MHESIQMSQMLYTGISTNNFPHGTVTQKGHGQKCLNRQSSLTEQKWDHPRSQPPTAKLSSIVHSHSVDSKHIRIDSIGHSDLD